MKRYIDPPGGWRYGFPKELPSGVIDFNKWLVDNGYPQSEIDLWDGRVPCGVSYIDEPDAV